MHKKNRVCSLSLDLIVLFLSLFPKIIYQNDAKNHYAHHGLWALIHGKARQHAHPPRVSYEELHNACLMRQRQNAPRADPTWIRLVIQCDE